MTDIHNMIIAFYMIIKTHNLSSGGSRAGFWGGQPHHRVVWGVWNTLQGSGESRGNFSKLYVKYGGFKVF